MTLREMREKAGLTQEQAAERVGVRQSAISAIELGRVANPTIDTVKRIAAAYGQPLDVVAAALAPEPA